MRKGLHVSEYGILDDATGETLRCATEEEVYARLGLPWIPPELREDRGELEPGYVVPAAGRAGRPQGRPALPHGRLRRAQHRAGDGARRAGARAGVHRDHRPLGDARLRQRRQPDELRRQIELVRKINDELDGIEVLVGTETNILPDGSPDYDDDLLAQLDWVVGSVHTSFGMSQAEMTKRIVAAIEHPWIDCIGHLTGRKIERRKPYEVDIDAVFAAAAAARARCWRSTPRPTAATSTTSTPAPPARPACRSSSTPTPTASRPRASRAGASRPRAAPASPRPTSPTRCRGRSSRRCASARAPP